MFIIPLQYNFVKSIYQLSMMITSVSLIYDQIENMEL